jgi:hypothetical protein
MLISPLISTPSPLFEKNIAVNTGRRPTTPATAPAPGHSFAPVHSLRVLICSAE